MAYIMKLGRISIDNTPIYLVDTEDSVMGQALVSYSGGLITKKAK